MDQPQFPFANFVLSRGQATAKAWQLATNLGDDRQVIFYGLNVFQDAGQDPERVVQELTQRILDTIHYHRQLLAGHRVSMTTEDFFEQCLQKINSEINVFLRDYASPLPVHTWSMLMSMVVKDRGEERSQFFISRFGDIHGWLLHSASAQNRKMISIFDAPDPMAGHAGVQKYFKQILSSTLSPLDQLFFCTPNLFTYLSLSDIKKILSELSAGAACRHLENLLRDQAHETVLAAASLRLSTAPTRPSTPATPVRVNQAEQSMRSMINKQSQTEQLLTTNASLQASRVGSAMRWVGTFFSNVGQSAGAALADTKIFSGPLARWQNRDRKSSPAGRAANTKPRSPMVSAELVSANQTIARFSLWKTYGIRLWTPIRRTWESFAKTRNIDMRKVWRSPRTYGIVAAVVVLVVIGVIYHRKSVAAAARLADAQVQLNTVRMTMDRVDSYLIVGRETDAITLVQQSADTLALVPDDIASLQDTKKQYAQKISEQQSQLRKEIVVHDPTTLISDLKTRLNGPSAFLVPTANDLVILGENPHTLIEVDQQTHKSATHAITTDLDAVRAATWDEGRNIIMIDGNKVVQVDYKKGQASSTAVANTGDTLQPAGEYNGHVYVVDSKAQQILKSNKLPNASVFSVWLKSPNAGVLNAKDMAIDGSLYLVGPSGLTQYLQGSQVSTLKLDPVDPPMNNAQHIVFGPDNQFLFILEPQRLLVYKKTGKFVGQYKFDNADPMIDAYVSEKDKTAYVLTDNSLVSFPMQLAP